MRLLMFLVMVAVVGCVAGEPARQSRWPTHRKDKDQKIEELLTRVDKLEKELADLQAYVARLRVKQPAAATPDAAPPAPPPPSGSLPQSGGATP